MASIGLMFEPPYKERTVHCMLDGVIHRVVISGGQVQWAEPVYIGYRESYDTEGRRRVSIDCLHRLSDDGHVELCASSTQSQLIHPCVSGWILLSTHNTCV